MVSSSFISSVIHAISPASHVADFNETFAVQKQEHVVVDGGGMDDVVACVVVSCDVVVADVAVGDVVDDVSVGEVVNDVVAGDVVVSVLTASAVLSVLYAI